MESHNSRPVSPNSKIPVTPESSAKLRMSVLKRHCICDSKDCSHSAESSRSARDTSNAICLNECQSLCVGGKDSRCRQAYYKGFIEGAAYGLHNSFQEKLNTFVDKLEEELGNDLQTLDQRSILQNLPAPPGHSRRCTTAQLDGSQDLCDFVCENACSCVGLSSELNSRLPRSRPVICSQPIGSGSMIMLDTANSTDRSFVFPDDKHCHGLEKLNVMAAVFIEPMDGFFEFLSSICPKFLMTTRYNIFHHETLPPVFTVSQVDNTWKYFETGNDLKFELNHNDYTKGKLETDLCLSVECTDFYSNYAKFHNAKFVLADSSVTLGCCKYFSASKYSPVLIIESHLTREVFLIRSRNYSPGYRDSDFMVLAYDQGGVIEDDEELEPDRTLVAIISRRVPKTLNEFRCTKNTQTYPLQERLEISYCGKVHPYVKATVIATTLVLKHDILK